jgi:hypothetical protein
VSIRIDGPSPNYSSSQLCYLLAVWCGHCHQLFNIEDAKLMEISGMLYQRVEVPSHITVSCDAYEMFQLSWQNVAQVLVVC